MDVFDPKKQYYLLSLYWVYRIMVAFDGNDTGLYIWRDPSRGGSPIKNSSDIDELITFAQTKGIRRILYDNFGTGVNYPFPESDLGSGLHSDEFLNNLISRLHENNILIEALYTDNIRFQNVINYNKTHEENKFDGIRMDFEGPWNRLPHETPGEFTEPVSNGDIGYFTMSKARSKGIKFPQLVVEAVDNLRIEYEIDDPTFTDRLVGIFDLAAETIVQSPTFPLYVSISWHWGRLDADTPDEMIEYNGILKFAYQHILDIVDGVDIQTVWGGQGAVAEICRRAKPIIQYARQIGKPVWITIETSDQAFDDNGVLDPNQTFEDEGIDFLESTVQEIKDKLAGDNCSPSGIVYHFYKNIYG